MSVATGTVTGSPEASRAEFERDGFVRVPRAIGAEQVERLRAAVGRTWARHRATPARAGAEALHLLAFAGRDRAFLELIDQPTILPFVISVLGPHIFMYHCHLDVHPPETETRDGRWMWHQDGGRQNIDLETEPRPRMSLKVAYFLSDCSVADRGNLRVIPGSHRRDRLTRPHEGGTPDPHGAIPILAAPGDAVVFDRRLWHMRDPNRSSVTRQALFYAYTYRWVRPRDDLAIGADLLSAITPIRAQLLGAGRSVIGYWMPDEDEAPLGSATRT